MKLYDSKLAPNPRKVRIFLAEKGVSVPIVAVDIIAGENRQPASLAKNPLGGLPVLELDDGRFLAESTAICRYFEGTHPDPPLMGVDAIDRAWVEMWNRRMEGEVLSQTGGCFRHTSSVFRGRFEQVPEYGEVCRRTATQRLAWLDGELGERPFIAGDRFTIADITALVGIDFGRICEIRIAPDQKNLQRWHEAVSARPSAAA